MNNGIVPLGGSLASQPSQRMMHDSPQIRTAITARACCFQYINGFRSTLAELVQAMQDNAAVTYATAAFAWLIYDFSLTIQDEISFIWSTRWSLHKVLFNFMRYYTPISIGLSLLARSSLKIKADTPLCQFYFWFSGLNTSLLPTLIGEALMAMRLYAFHGRSRKILVVVIALYIVEVTMEFWAAVRITTGMHIFHVPESMPMPGCVSTRPETQPTIAAGSVRLFVAAAFFLLMLWKHLQVMGYLDDTREKMSQEESRRLSPTLYGFFWDGTGYFLMVMCVESFVIIFTVMFGNRNLASMYQPWVLSTYAVASTRMVLGLRGSVMSDTTSDQYTVSLRFAV